MAGARTRRIAVWLAAAGLAVGGFTVGRLTAPTPPDATALACEDAERAYAEALDSATAHGPDSSDADPEEARHYASVALHAIVQNPECFSAGDRATAQTILEQGN